MLNIIISKSLLLLINIVKKCRKDLLQSVYDTYYKTCNSCRRKKRVKHNLHECEEFAYQYNNNPIELDIFIYNELCKIT